MTLRRCFLADAEATARLGQALADTLPEATQVVHLSGELGAGKSSLARALLRGLGVQGAIPSPTYTLVESYPTPSGEVLHLDLYRLGGSDELEFLALDDYVGRARLWLIEWPERGPAALPPATLKLALAIEGEGRCLRVECPDRVAQAWMRDAFARARLG